MEGSGIALEQFYDASNPDFARECLLQPMSNDCPDRSIFENVEVQVLILAKEDG
ncbi:hypothetical protein D9M71_842200 [compost metagenome]